MFVFSQDLHGRAAQRLHYNGYSDHLLLRHRSVQWVGNQCYQPKTCLNCYFVGNLPRKNAMCTRIFNSNFKYCLLDEQYPIPIYLIERETNVFYYRYWVGFKRMPLVKCGPKSWLGSKNIFPPEWSEMSFRWIFSTNEILLRHKWNAH